MRAIEGQILPPGFGRRLERAAFLAASEDREWEGADLEEEEAGGTESEAAAMAAGAEDVGDGDSWEAHFIACSRLRLEIKFIIVIRVHKGIDS